MCVVFDFLVGKTKDKCQYLKNVHAIKYIELNRVIVKRLINKLINLILFYPCKVLYLFLEPDFLITSIFKYFYPPII